MSEPVRVLHVVGSLGFGGIQAYLMNLYRSIDRTRVQFDFCVHIKTDESYIPEIEAMGGRVYYVDHDAFTKKNWLDYIRFWREFYLEHPEFRVIHGHLRSTAAIYLWIAKKLGRVTISHSHSTSNGKGAAAFVKDVMQLPIRYIADYMFACSDEAGKYLFGKAALKKENYKLIPNAIDCDRFKFNPQRRDEMRKELGLDDCFVIGHVGRLSEPKNHTFLLDVFAEVVKERQDARLLLVGDGSLREALEEKCRILGIYENVIFAGAKQNTEDYYQAMDVFVFPSLYEGLGIVAIEAQCEGLPVIVSQAVPTEAHLLDNVSVCTGYDQKKWAECVLQTRLTRESRSIEQIRKAGYDMKRVSYELAEFYLLDK